MTAVAGPPIAYVLKMYPRLSETFILNEILELERQGQQVHIFSLRPSDDRRTHDDVARVRAPVTVVAQDRWPWSRSVARSHLRLLRSHPARYLLALPRVAWHSGGAREAFNQAVLVAADVERLRIRHLHAHFASLPALVARHVERLTGVGFSFTAHAKDIYMHDVLPRELAATVRAARFAVTVSDYNAAYLRAIQPTGRIERVYNGLDLELFQPAGRPAATSGPPHVLAIGRLVEKKGFADLVAACHLLRAAGCEFRCSIVGRGALEPALRAQIEALDLTREVSLRGALVRDEVIGLYREAAVLVAPCVVGSDGNRDGLPTVLIEAMAIGVPVVATAVTGIPELVRDGETGLLVPERDPERLAAAIENVLVDPDAARRRAAAARELVEQEFDLRVNVAALRQRFEAAA